MGKCIITGEEIATAKDALDGDTLHTPATKAGVGVAIFFTKDNVRLANPCVSKAGAAKALREAADKIDPPKTK